MTRIASRPFLTALAVLAAGLGGCGGHNLPGDAGTVTGRATYEGRPLPAGAVVTFVHAERGLVGFGLTDEDGRFEIEMRNRPEVLVGEYQVSVIPPQDPALSRAIESGQPLTPTQKEFLAREWREIPEHYRQLGTSGEQFVVKPGANEYLLELVDRPARR